MLRDAVLALLAVLMVDVVDSVSSLSESDGCSIAANLEKKKTQRRVSGTYSCTWGLYGVCYGGDRQVAPHTRAVEPTTKLGTDKRSISLKSLELSV